MLGAKENENMINIRYLLINSLPEYDGFGNRGIALIYSLLN